MRRDEYTQLADHFEAADGTKDEQIERIIEEEREVLDRLDES